VRAGRSPRAVVQPRPVGGTRLEVNPIEFDGFTFKSKNPSPPSQYLCRVRAIMVLRYPMGSEAVSLNTVLEYVEKLEIEDQQYPQEIIHRRLVDAKRSALVHRAKQAKGNVKKNHCQSGTAKDLLADLNG